MVSTVGLVNNSVHRPAFTYATGGTESFFMGPRNVEKHFDRLGRESSFTRATDGKGYDTSFGGTTPRGYVAAATDTRGYVTYCECTDLGNFLKVTNPNGTFVEYTRDSLYLPLTVRDRLGGVTTFTRDASHRVTRIDYPDGTFEAFTYNGFGQILTRTMKNGGVESHTYDSRGLCLSKTNPLGQTWTYAYNALDLLVSTTDPLNRTTYVAYNARGQVVRKTHADGNFTENGYDNFGNLTSFTNERGDTWTYEYDQFRRKVRETDSLGRVTTSEYHTNSYFDFPLSKTYPNGRKDVYVYDNMWNLLSITTAYGTPQAATTTSTYDARNNVIQVVNAKGGVTTSTYDSENRRISSTDPLGNVTQWTYDGAGNLLSTIRPGNLITSSTYDSMNRPLTGTDAQGNVTQFTYDSFGNVAQVTNAKGQVTTTSYDLLGRLTSTQYADGATQSITYDAVGNVAGITDALGNVTTFQYDVRDRRTSQTSPAVNGVQAVTSWTYDVTGLVLTTTDPKGNVTTSTYDAGNPVVSTALPLGVTTSTTYDVMNNVLTATDPNGNVTTNTYDILGRRATTTTAEGITVSFTFDALNNQLSITDGNGNATQFTYDALNRLLTTTDVAGRTESSTYGALTRTSFTDKNGNTTYFTYDNNLRVISTSYVGVGSSSPGDNINSSKFFTYDALGNVLVVSEPGKGGATDLAYTYNLRNRIQTETTGGVTHHYSYDLNGNLLAALYGGSGRTITHTYDALNRLTSSTEGGRTTARQYDLNSNLVVKTLPNGSTETATVNALNRVTSREIRSTSNFLLGLQDYTYDPAGNVTQVAETYATAASLPNRTITNTYDADNRLKVETTAYGNANLAGAAPADSATAYTYDNNNNRLTKVVTGGPAPSATTYTYNNLNQLTQYTDGSRLVQLGYDLHGNRTTRTVSGAPDAGTDSYSYDKENRLVQLHRQPTGGGAASTYTYAYDSRTRRILRDESLAGGATTQVIFSGGLSIYEVEAGNITVETIRGPGEGGIGSLLYTLRSGTPAYAHSNLRGDIVTRTDSAGSPLFQAQYEAYGTRPLEAGTTPDRQRANTKDEDPTGLLNEGMRYRDLETGSFITPDPAGFVDGPNFYTYVVCNPWTLVDPHGLCAEDIEDAGDTGDPFRTIYAVNDGATWDDPIYQSTLVGSIFDSRPPGIVRNTESAPRTPVDPTPPRAPPRGPRNSGDVVQDSIQKLESQPVPVRTYAQDVADIAYIKNVYGGQLPGGVFTEALMHTGAWAARSADALETARVVLETGMTLAAVVQGGGLIFGLEAVDIHLSQSMEAAMRTKE
ncbi:hypothetical protein DB346_11040, partial [Verrucomicrobia bacterium LW23]